MRCARVRIAAPPSVAVALLVAAAMAAGCGGNGKPCLAMGAMSDIVARAAVVRLDVYDAGARCAGGSVAEGAPPPSLSKVAAAGQPLTLDVPAGAHLLVLSAFADAAGTRLIGSACTTADVHAGQPLCLDLTLAELPDLALPGGGDVDLARPACSPAPDDCPVGQYCASDGNCAAGCKAAADCAATPATPLCDTVGHRCVQCLGPSDCPLGKQCSPSGSCVDGCVAAAPNCPGADQCCGNLCIDVTSDLSNCGACGRACASAHVTTPACNSKLCAPTCAAGWADCNHPIAPVADDGCETNVYDVNRCGACNAPACSLAHATAACPAGSCTVAACAAGWFDCDAKPADGCECAGTDLGDGAHGCCAGGCQTQHNDGFGHAFYDCIAAGTYSEALARDAAHAYDAAVTPFGNTCPNGTTKVICAMSSSACTCWAYADSANAGSAVGRARQNTTSSTCYCPTSGDQPWG